MSGSSRARQGTKEVFEVEDIVDDRMIGKRQYFFLKWKGYESEQNTWEPAENLDCPQLIQQYKDRKGVIEARRRKYARGIDLSTLYRNMPVLHQVRVFNTVDDEIMPVDFTYTNDNIARDGVPRPSNVVFPCSCAEGECGGPNCDCMQTQYHDHHGLLRTDLCIPLHECNYLCSCPPTCPNRVVQRGNIISIDIFRTIEKGWAARTRKPIRRGEFIVRYTGELITLKTAERRGMGIHTYLFDLDKEVPAGRDPEFTIDASHFGNVSRFFNHSCDPNMAIWAIYINHIDPRLHELAFFAIKDIGPGEELTFDYCPDSSSQIEPNTSRFRCLCGSPLCRGYIF